MVKFRTLNGIFFGTILMSLLLLIIPSTGLVSGKSASSGTLTIEDVETDIQTLFPGDIAQVKIALYNPGDDDIMINSITAMGEGIKSTPILNPGYMAGKSRQIFIIPVRAVEPGMHVITIKVHTGTRFTTSNLILNVEDSLPGLSFDRDIRKGEVNHVNLKLYSPANIKNVLIEPEFKSEPRTIFLDEVKGSLNIPFSFFPDGIKEYTFHITFHNGINQHSYLATIQPEFEMSKGVSVNISIPSNNLYLYDVIPIQIALTNLRNDDIYSLHITPESGKGVFSRGSEIAILNSGESRTSKIYYSPHSPGEDVILLKINYSDESGNVNVIQRTINVKILNQPSVSLTNLNIKIKSQSATSPPQRRGFFRPARTPERPSSIQITLSGDISNNGISPVKNVYVHTDSGKDYFVGSIDPSDVESFSISTGKVKISRVTVTWTNSLGEEFSISKSQTFRPPATPLQNKTGTNFFNIILVVVAISALYVILRILRGKR